MTMSYFSAWLKLSADISGNAKQKPILQCPECRKETIDFQYVGDKETRIGYLDIWCNSCMNGIHISRVRVPVLADLIGFKDAELKRRVPDFKQVER